MITNKDYNPLFTLKLCPSYDYEVEFKETATKEINEQQQRLDTEEFSISLEDMTDTRITFRMIECTNGQEVETALDVEKYLALKFFKSAIALLEITEKEEGWT